MRDLPRSFAAVGIGFLTILCTLSAHAGNIFGADIPCSVIATTPFASLNAIEKSHELNMLSLDTNGYGLIQSDAQLRQWTKEAIIDCGQHPVGETLLSSMKKTYARLAKIAHQFQALTGRTH
jgi:hypothetical protein